jgi:hypothetical protein
VVVDIMPLSPRRGSGSSKVGEVYTHNYNLLMTALRAKPGSHKGNQNVLKENKDELCKAWAQVCLPAEALLNSTVQLQIKSLPEKTYI